MKEEWKPDELRATSEEIRGAVMPKSITPDMVGGALLGLVNAVGEVVDVLGKIPREHVKIKVRGYDGTGGVSGAGATVWLDVFHTKGYPVVSLPRQELTCNDEGVVEFDIPHGFKYAVFSQIAGLGASFQLVETAVSDKREISLWNLPIGIKHLYVAVICNNNGIFRGIPKVTDSYVGYIDMDDEDLKAEWGWDIDPVKEEFLDDRYYYGIVVSMSDTCFAIGVDSKSEAKIQWCGNRDYGTLIPGVPAINYHTEAGRYKGDFEEAKSQASADMDGNMNTTKILDYLHNPIAADSCTDYVGYSDEQRWLPSCGQASLIQLNRKVINTLMQEFLDDGNEGFVLLPDYKAGSTTQWTHYEYWWTSTIFDAYYSWCVDFNGPINYFRSDNTRDVRAVSAFHFEYLE